MLRAITLVSSLPKWTDVCAISTVPSYIPQLRGISSTVHAPRATLPFAMSTSIFSPSPALAQAKFRRVYRGLAGPPLVLACTTTHRLPHLCGFCKSGRCEPRSQCSFVTAKAPPSVLYLAYAQPPASLLRRGILPLHHHELLPAASAAGQFLTFSCRADCRGPQRLKPESVRRRLRHD